MTQHRPERPDHSTRALIIVDVQNDFCEGGSLAVAGGTEVAGAISDYVVAAQTSGRHGPGEEHKPAGARVPARSAYAAVVATADWHVDPGAHFATAPDFRDTWPVHCVADSAGAQFHPALTPALARVDAVFRKGRTAAAYSGFEGTTLDEDGAEIGLAEWLRDCGVEDVDVVGIATDHCVRATALDAVRAGLGTRVLLELTAGVAAATTTAALAELREVGVELAGTPKLPSA